jgi:hypothetical protein
VNFLKPGAITVTLRSINLPLANFAGTVREFSLPSTVEPDVHLYVDLAFSGSLEIQAEMTCPTEELPSRVNLVDCVAKELACAGGAKKTPSNISSAVKVDKVDFRMRPPYRLWIYSTRAIYFGSLLGTQPLY